jgi:type IV pilus assembly protein PilY1
MVDQATSAPFKTFLDVPSLTAPLPGSYTHRADVRCWKDIGRALYFIDVQNGHLIKKIHAKSSGQLVFPSPLVSTPALFENDIGTIASRAFITDADGVIWRVDLSAPDQDDDGTHIRPLTGWTARPFHDIFWGKNPPDGELSYEAPLMSVDPSGRLVVIVGTGDNNNFVKPTINNRVVSLTEIIDPTRTPSGVPEDYKAAVNWELRSKPTDGTNLVPSELVTGSMGLFNGQLFFGTFIAITSGNACNVGRGRVHAVDYLARDPVDTNTDASPTTHGPLHISTSVLGLDAEGQTAVNVTSNNALDNFMVLGLGITERPSCEVVDTADFNVWGQSTFGVKNATAPSIYLVAQASGNTGVGSLIQKRSRSVLGSVQIRLNKKTSMSRVTSWATSVD